MEQEAVPKIYTISAITKSIKNTLEGSDEFNALWLKGEIYNLTYHSSGHIYFTLKDPNAIISAVFFKFANKNLNFKLKEGMSILAFGNITVFEKRGSYQINVKAVRPEGIGELQKKIDELKKKLLSEGIFDDSRKKPLPFLPRRLGIVTSPTGAAFRDIVKVALRRYSNIEIVLAPAKVQGEDAAETIAHAIKELNKIEYNLDVIIAGRGGGSFEDLMAFNEEVVVRAFAESKVPIISAVGHQIDHPLSDDAADASAPTPSAAAELAIPLKEDLTGEIEYHLIRIQNYISSLFREYQSRMESLSRRRIFRDPYEIITKREMALQDLESRITATVTTRIAELKGRFLSIPDISMIIRSLLDKKLYNFNLILQSLEQLSPITIMKRGFSIVLDETGKTIKSINDTSADSFIKLLLRDGSLSCTVNSISEEKIYGKEES